MGVIDSDYYFSDNEGHIFAKLTNDSKSGRVAYVEAGSAFMQAIFIPYGITWSDNATGVRNGGAWGLPTADCQSSLNELMNKKAAQGEH